MADDITRRLLARATAPQRTRTMGSGSGSPIIQQSHNEPELDWQPWITLKGSGNTRIVQGSDGWINLGDFPAVSARVEIGFITAGTTLRVETSVAYDGPFRDVILQTAQGAQTYVLGTEPFGATAALRRYLRYAVQPPAGDWVICFRIGLSTPGGLVAPPNPIYGDAGSSIPDSGFGILAPWTTLSGTWVTTNDDIVAPEEYWLDLSREVYAFVEAQTLAMNNGANAANLYVETAMYREGPWTTVLGPLSTDNTTSAMKMTLEGPYAVALMRYVRWRVTAAAAPWHACFRIGARWA